MKKEAAQYHPEMKAMNIGKEDETIIVIPEEEPIYLPGEKPVEEPVPVKEPERVPEKIPAHVGAGDPKKVSGVKVGYRVGNVSFHTGEWKVHSPMYNLDWERGPVEASCSRGEKGCSDCGGSGQDQNVNTSQCQSCKGTGKTGHEAPAEGCHCGLYAKWNADDLQNDFGKDKWMTKVHAWGRIVPAEIGFRAQHMQIQSIEPPFCSRCDEPATHLVGLEGTKAGIPVCAEHKPMSDNIGGKSLQVWPVEEISKKLATFYGAEIQSQGSMKSESEGKGYEKVSRDKGDIPNGYPKGFVPRIDEAGAKARKNNQLQQLDEEAAELQDKVKQFAGFKPKDNGFKETKVVKIKK